MQAAEILLIALAMSIDAFSVALSVGCGGFKKNVGLKLALLFGLFQFIMPLLGANLGQVLDSYFSGTKYIAAGILFFIAFKMFKDARNKSQECILEISFAKMLALAVATSIDAFGVGISIALLPYSIYIASAVIGVVCFIISLFGFIMGGSYLSRFSKADYFGAAVLLIIGIKMLL